MKTAIIYASKHHKNTEKLVLAIAAAHDVALFDAEKDSIPSLDEYDCIGFASGIAYGKFYPSVSAAAEKYMTAGKKIFFLYTCGSHNRDMARVLKFLGEERGCKVLGSFGCPGFDTYGPFKLIGGISKNRPNEKDISDAVRFFETEVSAEV
ncbi:MAG: flavodoxin [Clostridiales bacterium]|nr:flavodoxin [Clostridiales bacterium]